MIITLTGNLLAETTFDFPSWKTGATQRASAQSFQVGGKGINVSKMLCRLKAPTLALCFPGGTTGDACTQWLKQNKIPYRAFLSKNNTRVGLVVRAPGCRETSFLGPDLPPDTKAFAACAKFIRNLPSNAFLALCGSVPGWESSAAAPLRTALIQHAKNKILAVDTYGPPLAQLCKAPLRLIKINRTEFDGLFPVKNTKQTIAQRLTNVCSKYPVHSWIITNGPHKIWFIEKNMPPASLSPLKVTQVSPTGSGDVFFACVLNALLNQKNTLADAIKSAIPFASANAAHSGIADFDPMLISKTL